jgi:UDP-3-O-[3-hydroxymyristoyl] N-acetylglucosamine deacetylase
VRTQRTLKEEIVIEGIGLHSGAHSIVRLKPAPQDNGVVFYRKDRGVYIHATLNAVCDTAYATTLGLNGTKVKTVEHLLAALAGLGIDNVEIELDGPEVPIMDGSGGNFADAISSCGAASQLSKRPHMKITKPFIFSEGDAEIAALPCNARLITYQISYPHRLLGTQQMTIELEEESFREEIAPARTFGFLKDVQVLRARGLAKGGSLENAVILSDTGVVNPTGLRYKDEFLRHKLLDFIGDLSLTGFPVIGHITARRTGHTTNLKFARHLLAATDCWEIVTESEAVRVRKPEGLSPKGLKPSVKYA